MLPIKAALLYPTILIHGIGGDTSDLLDIKNSLEGHGAEVYNMEIGNGKIDSIFWNINKQCLTLSDNIYNLSLKSDKINLLGLSQGGLLARCYVEKYSNLVKPVHSLITYGTPHMGIYNSLIELKRLEYWKNPFKYQEYLQTNNFLAYINNERLHPDVKLYKDNILSLDNFLVVWTDLEQVVSPKESTKFEFYNISLAEITGTLKTVDLKDSDLYSEDILGLKQLNNTGRLFIEKFNCRHEEFKHPKCFNANFLNQPYSLMDITLSLL